MSQSAQTPINPEEAVLDAAIDRMRKNIFLYSFVPWKFHPRNASFEPNAEASRCYVKLIVIQKLKQSDASDESYTLNISEDGKVLMSIIHPNGGLHALTTFTQLFYKHSASNPDIYLSNAPIYIKDAPKFQHRGLNLDISRNYISPKDVMRVIDALSFNKLNRLHLHASDAQSWPLEIPALPDLAWKGAYHSSQIWTAADLLEVQTFGAQRGVEVYLEIDMPGHTAVIANAYPDLIAALNQEPWENYSLQPPAGQLLLNSTAVYDFLSTLLNDLLPRTSPFTTLFHFGGDEVNTHVYNLPTPALHRLLQNFTNHLHTLAATHGISPVVWEELLLDQNLTLPPTTIIQSWRSPSSLAAITAKGHRALFGPHTHWYLDCGHGTFLDPLPSSSQLHPPFRDYCSPLKNWRHIYSFDPLTTLSSTHHPLVLGGEIHLWTELTDAITLDAMLWPRAAAAAEILWRGAASVNEDVTRRLADARERLIRSGVGASVVQGSWCLMNEGRCKL